VLVVDDHVSFRSMAIRLLTGSGFSVIGETGSGAGAVRATEELRPDLVLLDIQLPDIDGFVVAEALAGLQVRPDVVLMSSRSSTDYGSKVSDAPVAGFIPKADLSGGAVRRLLSGPVSPPA